METAKKEKKPGILFRLLGWMLKRLGRLGTFIVVRIGIPIVWLGVMIYIAAEQSDKYAEIYAINPVATIAVTIGWVVLGGAFAPISRRFYTMASVVAMLGGVAASVLILGIDVTEKWTAIIGGSIVAGFCMAWLGGAGTTIWKFAHNKMPTDDDDT